MTLESIIPNPDESTDALSDFLLTFILVDDHADLNENQDQRPEGGGHGLNAKAIVDAFADRGIVCGVLKPKAEENIVRRARSIARRADVVILDWVLKEGDEDGELACEILTALLESDDAQHMLRFFVIYTGTPQLRDISKRCQSLLGSLNVEFPIEDGDEFTLRRGPVTLSIFSKDTVPESGDDSLDDRRAGPAELPKKILADYRKKPPGLLESAALRSVAQVRSRTHRLLARFPSALDAGYLWHRAVLPDQDDAASQIVEMIGAEITDVINSDLVRSEVSASAAISWLVKREAVMKRVGQFEKLVSTDLDYVRLVVEIGAEAAAKKLVRQIKVFRDEGPKLGLPIFADDVAKMEASHESFAMLIGLRDREEHPSLRSGVIVQVESNFFLCVQPLCDSVRLADQLGEQVAFPFLRLLEPGEETKGRFNIVIPVEKGNRIRLMIPQKPSFLTILDFPKDGETIAAVKEDEQLIFRRTKSAPAVYRATLRPMKAVSVVTLLASMLSRTGTDESEWLRARAKS